MKAWTAAFEPMSMPLVGSSRMMTRGRVASHLAITTFCWLPPESPTGCSQLAALTASRSPSARVAARSEPVERNQPRTWRASEASVMLARMPSGSTTPCSRRSSGT
ncbi:MAG: hypothetical protein R3D25_04570 [Geminicoccaceae bacterium]